MAVALLEISAPQRLGHSPAEAGTTAPKVAADHETSGSQKVTIFGRLGDIRRESAKCLGA